MTPFKHRKIGTYRGLKKAITALTVLFIYTEKFLGNLSAIAPKISI